MEGKGKEKNWIELQIKMNQIWIHVFFLINLKTYVDTDVAFSNAK